MSKYRTLEELIAALTKTVNLIANMFSGIPKTDAANDNWLDTEGTPC